MPRHSELYCRTLPATCQQLFYTTNIIKCILGTLGPFRIQHFLPVSRVGRRASLESRCLRNGLLGQEFWDYIDYLVWFVLTVESLGVPEEANT